MANVLIKDMPVEAGLEFRAVISLDFLDLERQPGKDVVEELDSGLLVGPRIGPKDAQSGAIVDRGVLE
jgi:hypothetical protein